MDLRTRFTRRLNEAAVGLGGDPALAPQMLVSACVEVLGVDAAGLSTTRGIRVPWASSNRDAAIAERLQTTLGDGPCLGAAARGVAVAASQEEIADRWPTYHRRLLDLTPFRSVASLPLRRPRHDPAAVLDLYSAEPSGAPFRDLDVIQTDIADVMMPVLAETLAGWPELTLSVPPWMDTDPVRDRMAVWTAVGMVMADTGATSDASLDLLRAYALTTGTTLDDLAWQLTTRQVRTSDVTS